MKIVAAYVAYQDADIFERSLKSVEPHVDSIVVCEGAYSQLPGAGERPSSTDETLEIAEQYADKVVTPPNGCPWPSMEYQRNRMLTMVDKGDWLFRIDADEFVEHFDRDVFEEKEEEGALDLWLQMNEFRENNGNVELDHQHFRWMASKVRPGLHFRHRDGIHMHGEDLAKSHEVDEASSRVCVNHRPYLREGERAEVREKHKQNVANNQGGV